MGTSSVTDPTTAGDFFTLVTDNVTAVSRITIKASTILPTTFMKLGNFDQVTVGASGEATRRMVDLSLILDVSGSIGWRWPYVRDAARTFVDAFDPLHDRLSLITYSTGSVVLDQCPPVAALIGQRSRPTFQMGSRVGARPWRKGCIEDGMN